MKRQGEKNKNSRAKYGNHQGSLVFCPGCQRDIVLDGQELDFYIDEGTYCRHDSIYGCDCETRETLSVSYVCPCCTKRYLIEEEEVDYEVQLSGGGSYPFNEEELFVSKEDYFMHLLEHYTKKLEAVSKNRLTVIRWLQKEADNQ